MFLDYFFARTLEKFVSEFNGEIKVVKFQNKIAVWAGGFEQSGPLVEKIWNNLPPAENVLILGLGCGSILKNLKSKRVTGVEIDPVMIDIGKKYFDYKNTKIIIDSGRAALARMTQLFDLIIVDMYKSGKIQELIVPTNHLTKDGIIVYNQLDFGKDKIDLLSYLDKNPGIAVKEIRKFEYNKLIFCSKK